MHGRLACDTQVEFKTSDPLIGTELENVGEGTGGGGWWVKARKKGAEGEGDYLLARTEGYNVEYVWKAASELASCRSEL